MGKDLQQVDEIIEKNNYDQGAAMIMLQQVQASYGYISPEMIERITELTDIPASDIYGVVTFYSQFRLTPVGEKLIQVCHGTACHLAGAEQLSDAVITATGAQAGETSDDGKFTLEHVACLGCCSHGPVMTINDEVYAKMTPEKVKRLIKQQKKEKPANGGCQCASTGKGCENNG